MARPLKKTVDYFPHFVTPSRTLLILQNEYGNDGYAFWFKLLSLLCKSDGLVFDYNNPASWRLLLAETHVNEDNVNGILKLLSDVNAIDPDLYSKKIIWVQNLVDNLSDVFTRRRDGSTPEKPVNVNNNPVNVNKNTQTILNKTKLNHTKQDNNKGLSLPEWLDKKIWIDYLEFRNKIKKPATIKAQELLLKKLGDLRTAGNDPVKVLEQSIMNSWQGIFPLKEGDGGNHNGKNQRSGTKDYSIENYRAKHG